MKPLSMQARLTRVRDLEHHSRCYVNAYVMELEGRKAGSNQLSPNELCAREWGILCDYMFDILVQEGRVGVIREEEDEEENDAN